MHSNIQIISHMGADDIYLFGSVRLFSVSRHDFTYVHGEIQKKQWWNMKDYMGHFIMLTTSVA